MTGGARLRSGPAPDPDALRPSGEWVTLPAEGREGDPPSWPLGRGTVREREVWAELWRRPQALMWERQSQELEVALYVRRFVEAEKPKSAVSLTTVCRQMQDSLGLSTPGLRGNRWKIEQPPAADTRPSLTVVSTRGRFRGVEG